MDLATLKTKLASIGQEHTLRFYDQLDAAGKRQLLNQLAALNFDALPEMVREYVIHKPQFPLPQKIEPVKPYPNHPTDPQTSDLYAQARARGMELLRQGKVAAFLVAGGQGTRLGYDGPKGEFPVTPLKNKPLFQVFAEQLLAHSRDAGKPIPWYIMTSDANDAATRAFFARNNNFGYDGTNLFFFQQGMMPAFSMDGRILLASKDSLALSPDGHGGSLRALHVSGALADMRRRGVEHLSYFQVDNPLVQCIDPLFLGLHDLSGSEMSSKTVAKAHPLERVGNFAIGDGKLQVIEYSDLPETLARQMGPDGRPLFDAGSIAIHALRVSFVERLNAGGQLNLPWHRAEKKVSYIDPHGKEIKPDKTNAVKLEQFVFDAIPLAANAIVYTTLRREEFSPVKNAQGDDSPTTSKRDQVRRAAEWLEIAGVNVECENSEPGAVIEISPLFATSAAQLKTRNLGLKEVTRGQRVYFGENGAEVEG